MLFLQSWSWAQIITSCPLLCYESVERVSVHWFCWCECLCVFSRSDDIISWTAKLFPQSLFVLYEQICPNDPFGWIMQNHFLKMNSRLHAITKYPDCAAQKRRFLDQASMYDISVVISLAFNDLMTWNIMLLLSGLGRVCLSGYEPVLSWASLRGRAMQGGESGAFWWIWGKLLIFKNIMLQM